MSGWRVPGFTEVRELGAGGQGRAVLVREDGSGRLMVLKYVFAAADPETREWFRRESALMKGVVSPYVARWYDYFDDPSGSAILMEAIDGISLREVIAEHGSLDPLASLVVLKGSLLGLAAAHAVSVVHRDYKPNNVVVRGDGVSKLIDFGIAALSGGRGPRAGTPAYMAPEQWRDEPATPATDVYAATCVFFECVTGRRPYEADGVATWRAQHVGAPIPVEDVPEPLRPLIEHGMAKDATARFASAARFVDELEEAATHAYGPEWETRGARRLAMLGTALAALFPLAGLLAGSGGTTTGAGAAGGTGTSGTGTSGGSTAHGTAHLTRVAGTKLGAKVAVGLGVGAVVAAGAAGVYVSRPHHRPTRTATPTPLVRPVSFDVRTESRNFPGMPFDLDRAQYITVSGYRDPAIQQKVDQALHEPIDTGVAEARAMWGDFCKRNQQPSPRTPRPIHVSARIVLRGPRVLSVLSIVDVPVCVAGGSSIASRAVNIDLTTGRVLTQADIFRTGVLTQAGFRALADRVPQPKANGACDYMPMTLYRGSISGMSIGLASDHLEFNWYPGENCMGLFTMVKVPYARLSDLLNPQILALVGASAANSPSPSGRPSPSNS
ncbi:serine/threonine-protein kinase [Actinoallomurus sp. CA-150999]|uniref:serine/threonine-protein kinase n=1 Tax=Actinoallomurus sp. CA-150999 TaxID=3239887 RepID=UPI003D9180CB